MLVEDHTGKIEFVFHCMMRILVPLLDEKYEKAKAYITVCYQGNEKITCRQVHM
jgi:hypothetical protein